MDVNGTFEQFDNDQELQKRREQLKALYGEFNEFKAKVGGTFHIGEEIELRGSLFKVKKITPKGMTLKLLKKKVATGDGETLGLSDALGDTLGETLGETLGLSDALGDTLGLTDGETEGDALADGLTDDDTLGDIDGD